MARIEADAQAIGVVIGYLPEVDALHPKAEHARLHARCAFVLDSRRPGHADHVFDCEMYRAVLNSVWNVMSPSAAFVAREGARERVRDADEACRIADAGLHEPHDQLELWRDDRLIALITSEPYARLGGPEPYHDAFVVPVFTAVDASKELLRACQETSRATGFRVIELRRGLSEQSLRPWWRAWLRTLFR